MKRILANPDIHFGFYDFNETEIFLEEVGYNDFHYVTPIRTFRRQNFYTLHLVLSGSGILTLKNKKFTVPPHHFFFVPPDADMMYVPCEGDEWEYVWFAFNGSNSLQYMHKIGVSRENPVMECRAFSRIYAQLCDLFRQETAGDRYYQAMSAFYQILAVSSPESKKPEGNFSGEVKSYIALHYHNQNFSMEQLCRDMNVSHASLCRNFKNQVGETPIQYLADIRLRESCKLLQDTEMKISEIAYSVGFSDPYHFMKVFRRKYGVTPSQFRTKNSGNHSADFRE